MSAVAFYRPGQRVLIYQDPLTREIEEGVATLVSLVNVDEVSGVETWNVRFDGESFAYRRRLFPDDLTEAWS